MDHLVSRSMEGGDCSADLQRTDHGNREKMSPASQEERPKEELTVARSLQTACVLV